MRIFWVLALGLMLVGCDSDDVAVTDNSDEKSFDLTVARTEVTELLKDYVESCQEDGSEDKATRLVQAWSVAELLEDLFGEELETYTDDEKQAVQKNLTDSLAKLLTSPTLASVLEQASEATYDADRQDAETMWASVQTATSSGDSIEWVFLFRKMDDQWLIVDLGGATSSLSEELKASRQAATGTLVSWSESLDEELSGLAERIADVPTDE